MNIETDTRNLAKWLNEEQTAPIDRQALARVLAHLQRPAVQGEPVAGAKRTNELLEIFDVEHTEVSGCNTTTPQPAVQGEPVNKYCCHTCFNKSGQAFLDRMILCPECGNKRCPKATHHELPCTNSNEPGQAGSIYTTPQPAVPERKPLTDEEIHKASTQAGMQEHYMGFHSGFIRFARAIEAANGIKKDA